MSRLSAFCLRLIEASWLAAILLAPLFFNVYSSRVFEPDKISLVRTLALVMVTAWLIARAETIRQPVAPRRGEKPAILVERLRVAAERLSVQNPLALPTLGLVLIYLISTLASVSPSVSLLGSYQRLQGLYTTLSYIVIFFLAASTIRTRAQVDRAVLVALFASFPVAFYGIIQHYFLDPLPWGGDTTARVASNMGNSIFVGAYLIVVIPLAIGRLIQQLRTVAESESRIRAIWLYVGAFASILTIAGVWVLAFEFGAKGLIEKGFQGTLTPEMLSASISNFTLALIVTLVVVFAWWLGGLLLKQRAGVFLLVSLYSLLIAFQSATLLFSQSRGPQLGLLAGLFLLLILIALVRGARRLALGALATAVIIAGVLLLSNLTPSLSFFRDLPYVGRLAHIFDTEGGTGKVRVLIWQGAVGLVLPHAPLWSPTGGSDALNPIRPFIGYGPETLSVAYNAFYPPDLAHLESRNATPDRAHNETFDALITTGLLGLVAENVIFLAVFYFGLKQLGLVNTARQRNALIALWYAGGLAAALILGALLGWQYFGVLLPAGMIVGLFFYLGARAAIPGWSEERAALDPFRSLTVMVILAAIAGHFVEIHFGIAIVSTRLYFWFLAGLLVAIGLRVGEGVEQPAPVVVEPVEPVRSSKRLPAGRATRIKKKPKDPGEQLAPQVISTTPLIALAFLAGLMLATMGFDYITTNSLPTDGSQSGLGLIANALTTRATTAGPAFSPAMLWLFVGSFVFALGVALAEWGKNARLPVREWLLAGALFGALALAILASFLLYHTLLLTTAGQGIVDAIFTTVSLFVALMLVMAAVVALALLMDERGFTSIVARPANWVVAPVIAIITFIVLLSTNVNTVQADMIYKNASGLSSADTVQQGILLYHRALELQPTQDYYFLFLGRAYLDAARTAKDPDARDQSLNAAEKSLLSARELNPLNTDHSANLGRLHQSWAQLLPNEGDKSAHYEKALGYFGDALRLSPNTVFLYDQYAQVQLDYASSLQTAHAAEAAAAQQRAALDTLKRSAAIDPGFCLTYAVRAGGEADWQTTLQDAFEALRLTPECGDVFEPEGRGLAIQAIETAGDMAVEKGEGSQFAARIQEALSSQPGIELYTVLINHYSKTGQVDAALSATDAAMALIPANDTNTKKQYADFRQGLVDLQGLLRAVQANPNDVEAHRKLAQLWQARQQPQFALPEYRKVIELAPNDYEAHRRVVLLSLERGQVLDALSAISSTLTIAPLNDKPFWDQLALVVKAVQAGDKNAALTALDAIIKSVDSKDTLTLDALNAFRTKMQE